MASSNNKDSPIDEKRPCSPHIPGTEYALQDLPSSGFSITNFAPLLSSPASVMPIPGNTENSELLPRVVISSAQSAQTSAATNTAIFMAPTNPSRESTLESESKRRRREKKMKKKLLKKEKKKKKEGSSAIKKSSSVSKPSSLPPSSASYPMNTEDGSNSISFKCSSLKIADTTPKASSDPGTDKSIGDSTEIRGSKSSSKLTRKTMKSKRKLKEYLTEAIEDLTYISVLLEKWDDSSDKIEERKKELKRILKAYCKNLRKLGAIVRESNASFSVLNLPVGLIRHLDNNNNPQTWLRELCFQAYQENAFIRGELHYMGSFHETLKDYLRRSSADSVIVPMDNALPPQSVEQDCLKD